MANIPADLFSDPFENDPRLRRIRQQQAQRRAAELAAIAAASAQAPPLPSGALIGYDIDTGESVEIPDAARGTGVYALGVKGMGKSEFLLNLILHDIERGAGLAVLDPHGDLISDTIARMPESRLDDVIYWDVGDSDYPFGLNLYQAPEQLTDARINHYVGSIVHVFEKLFGISRSQTPRLMGYIRHTALVMLENPGATMVEVEKLFLDEQLRAAMLERVTNERTRALFAGFDKKGDAGRGQHVDPLLNKLDEFLSNPMVYHMVGQSRSSIDFRKAMDSGNIILVRLAAGAIGDSGISLMGTIIIAQILQAALGRESIDKTLRRPFHVYADEFTRFATHDFATIISEARKYGLETIIAHQVLSQIDTENRDAVMQVGVKVYFRVIDQDAAALTSTFDALPTEQRVAGYEPITVPIKDVVEHLVSTSFADKAIQTLSREFLTPAYRKSKEHEPTFRYNSRLTEEQNQDEKDRVETTCHEIQSARQAVDVVNDYFAQVMHEGSADAVPLNRWLFTVCAKAMGYRRFSTLLQTKRFAEVSSFARNPQGTASMVSSLIHDERKDWQDQLSRESERARQFIELVSQVAKTLAASPIRVASGQKQEVYSYETTSRSEIASILSRQEPWEAVCRITTPYGTRHHVIQTAQAPPPVPAEQLQPRIAHLVGRARAQFGTPKKDVITQIQNRQASLKRPQASAHPDSDGADAAQSAPVPAALPPVQTSTTRRASRY